MRPSFDETMLGVALVLAARASCFKRQVGCVLVDSKARIVGTGYNGRARGLPNCEAQPCCNGCEGVHAEVNALLQAHADWVHTAYVTCFPCWHCAKSLLNSGCKEIVTPARLELDADQQRARRMWIAAGRAAKEADYAARLLQA
jgi:dCMP deaminase